LFRDDTSLSATPHLWPMIEQALGQSRHFLLLASPEAAASRWVNKEVAFWLENNSVDTLLASYQASHAIRQRLTKSDPGNASWQRGLAVSYEKVGDVQEAQGKLADALASYQASLAIRERLAQSDPGNAGWQRDLSVSYEKVGDVQVASGASSPTRSPPIRRALPSPSAWRSPIPAMPTGSAIWPSSIRGLASCIVGPMILPRHWPRCGKAKPSWIA
jgi:hypothetical protein